jgi:hypothetical protein
VRKISNFFFISIYKKKLRASDMCKMIYKIERWKFTATMETNQHSTNELWMEGKNFERRHTPKLPNGRTKKWSWSGNLQTLIGKLNKCAIKMCINSIHGSINVWFHIKSTTESGIFTLTVWDWLVLIFSGLLLDMFRATKKKM